MTAAPGPSSPSDSIADDRRRSLTGAARGHFTVGPGANRPGVQLTSKLTDFVGRMAGDYHHGTLVVSTGTNHSQYSTSGLVSDHWQGNAADFGMVANGGTNDSVVGDRIATAALVAAGWGYTRAAAWARTGGLVNVPYGSGRVQVIWKTYIGGDHHNHVHVGIN